MALGLRLGEKYQGPQGGGTAPGAAELAPFQDPGLVISPSTMDPASAVVGRESERIWRGKSKTWAGLDRPSPAWAKEEREKKI